jgi:hypothetical protein
MKLFFFILLIFFSGTNMTKAKEFPLNLLFSREDIPRIRENTQRPLFNKYWKSLLAETQAPGNLLLREAFIYAITSDESRGQNARAELLKTSALERWDSFVEDGHLPIGFLKAGNLTRQVALAFDWIYDLLTPAERAEVLKQIAEKGCVPIVRGLTGMRFPETVKGWGMHPADQHEFEPRDMRRWPIILGNNNFRAVMSGGLALGIFALEGSDPRTEEWKEILLDSFHRFAQLYKADGSYDEGVGYSNYATEFLIYLMEVVHRKMGIDLFDAANFTGLIQFDLALFLPQHLRPVGSVNFGDAGTSLRSDVGHWIARKSRDGLAQYVAENFHDGHTLFSLIWYDPTVKPEAPVNHFLTKLDLDWVVARTGYQRDDLVVALRSGPPFNHEHADRNSVILKFAGEILFSDPYRPTYHHTDPGWFLRTSPAHNTVLIDDLGHPYHDGSEGTNESKAAAKIVRHGERQDYVFWASDATPAYALDNPDIKSVTRTVLVFHQIPALVVLDKLQKKIAPATFTARWHVENSDEKGGCAVNGNSFTNFRPHGKFMGVCAGTPEIFVKSDQHPLPEKTGIFPFVDVATRTPANEALLITAGCPLLAQEAAPEIQLVREEADWILQIAKGGRRLKLRILDRAALPEWEVLELGKKASGAHFRID